MNKTLKRLSLYIHIPFCVRKCLYCDFLSFNADNDLIDEYFKALGKEIVLNAGEYADYEVDSIFFGGGTPSFPDAKYICDTLSLIFESFHVSDKAEISLEVNPASAIFGKLNSYRRAGFNRISIGAQTLNDEELMKLGRVHNASMFYDTYENAKRAGFDNINIDLMSAIPGQSLESYLDTVKKVLSLRPEHISAYSLIVEEGTPFYDMELDVPSEDVDRKMYHETKSILAANGYHRYEISNYALSEDKECHHNKVYWTRGNYLGLGLGASSMVENVRWKNVSDIKKYIEIFAAKEDKDRNNVDKADVFVDNFKKYREDVEKLPIKSQMEEFMFLGLRLVRGVSLEEFKNNFSCDIHEVYAETIDKYKNMGLLKEYTIDGHTNLCLTDEGIDVSNTIMADFLFD
ncbi:MAG: radical SAM family heme chaperone HemW [Butyrivibrio sp.]|uniref:radical SAM family heme chaperone HemW n=1 Tax=Butyrivibrio sp. TaxID=28121 RepID=UPI001B0C714F|nr:radical SAM family heme chaperone HemW [Butyrivibrio sp.]MBO6241124.1 radical SAM family heme chaperone HemW [Butyrivibrio sp.]